MYRLSSEVRQMVERELGRPVPDPASPEFGDFLEQLRGENPALHARLLEGLVPDTAVRMPSEASAQRMRKRGMFARAVGALFAKRAWPHEQIVHKRRVVAALLVAFGLFFMPAVYLMNSASVRQSRTPGSGSTGTARQEAQKVEDAAHQPGPEGSSAGQTQVAEARERSPSDTQPPTGLLLPPVPANPEVLPPGSPPVAASAAASGAAGSPFAYSRPSTRQPGQADRSPSGIFQYSREARRAGGGEGASVFVYTRAAAAAGAQEEAASSPPEPSPSRAEASRAEPVSWKPGDIVPGVLVTGIATVQGLEAVPVVASSAPPGGCPEGKECEGAIWLGQARYQGGGRVAVEFTRVVAGGTALSVSAQAFGPDMVAGVPAKLSVRTPTAAAQLVGAAIGAAGDYFRALASRQQVTITNGWLTITQSGEPQFWQYLLAKIADLFRVGTSGPAAVQVAEVSPKTAVNILILGAGR